MIFFKIFKFCIEFQLASVTINFTNNHDYRAILYSLPGVPAAAEGTRRLVHGRSCMGISRNIQLFFQTIKYISKYVYTYSCLCGLNSLLSELETSPTRQPHAHWSTPLSPDASPTTDRIGLARLQS